LLCLPLPSFAMCLVCQSVSLKSHV
jgi:hypothetical protein